MMPRMPLAGDSPIAKRSRWCIFGPVKAARAAFGDNAPTSFLAISSPAVHSAFSSSPVLARVVRSNEVHLL